MINDEHPCLQHGQCKWFKVDADRNCSQCKRLDHKHIKFAVPWFKSYDCGQFSSQICADFEPAEWCKWLYEHWTGIEDFTDKPQGYVPLTLDDDTSVRYYVNYQDFYNNNFIDDNGELRWIYKQYYKRVKVSDENPIGIRLIKEEHIKEKN